MISSTLETPPAPPGEIMSAKRIREHGEAMLKAWNKTISLASDAKQPVHDRVIHVAGLKPSEGSQQNPGRPAVNLSLLAGEVRRRLRLHGKRGVKNRSNRMMAIAEMKRWSGAALVASLVCLLFAVVLAVPGLGRDAETAKARIAVNTKFAGGNVLVQKNAGAMVNITPDLRGGRPWFYWYFEATVEQPGRVAFVLPKKLTGLTGPPIGMQGPAVSLDLGKTWEWAGADHVKENTFFYEFNKAGQKVRFAVTMPYLQSNLDRFLKENEGNEHLTRGVLTKSLKGRPVELFRIGKPGPGAKAVLFTARHHACETMASFVLEGFLKAAMSDTPSGVEFRKKYVLYAVPFVDKDGVEEGDQGKNRNPHDHNRDYGEGSIFPEIDAIEKLGDSRNIQFLVDFHCPTLRYGDHQVMYFVGSKATPASNEENVKNFARLITEGLPPNSPHGPLVWLKKREPRAADDHCSNHFAFREGMIMAATIEIPFAPPKAIMNATRGREIGEAMLNAWVKTKFVGPAR